MWVDFSLTHAWLIPLLPALAFVVISFLLLRSPWLASRLAILAMASSFALSVGAGGSHSSEKDTVCRCARSRSMAAFFATVTA